MRLCVAEVCEVLMDNEERLNELDRGSGDGDCGSTMRAGCIGETQPHCIRIQTQKPFSKLYFLLLVRAAIKERLSFIDWDNPREALLSLARLVENHMGGTSGAVSLYSCIISHHRVCPLALFSVSDCWSNS